LLLPNASIGAVSCLPFSPFAPGRGTVTLADEAAVALRREKSEAIRRKRSAKIEGGAASDRGGARAMTEAMPECNF